MESRADRTLEDLLARVVPGTALREGLERILRAHMGALIVLGDDRSVLEICSGGFHIDAELSPQRLSELAKMDGAIVLNRTATRIAWANVHLVPDPSMPTSETGTRHRTAERVARHVAVSVIAASEEMGTITLYVGAEHRQLQPSEQLADQVNHLLQSLGRFRAHFDEAASTLAHAETRGLVTLGELAALLQRAEIVLRVAAEATTLIDQLGDQGRLMLPELRELTGGVAEEQQLVLRAYLGGEEETADATRALRALGLEDLRSLETIAPVIGRLGSSVSTSLPTPTRPRTRRRSRSLEATPKS